MARHLRNFAFFLVGFVLPFVFLSDAYAVGPFQVAGTRATGVSADVFRSGPSLSTTYTVEKSIVKDVTSTATDVTVYRETPFKTASRFGDTVSGVVIDAIKIGKESVLKPSLKNFMKWNLASIGLTLVADYAIQKGFEWMDDAKQYYKSDLVNPSGAIEGNTQLACTNRVTTVTYKINSQTADNGVTIYVPKGLPASTPVTNGSKLKFISYCSNGVSAVGSYFEDKYIAPTYTKGPATDQQINAFIDDLLTNQPRKLIDDLVARSLEVPYDEVLGSKTLKAPVATPSKTISTEVQLNPDGSKAEKVKKGTTAVTISPDGKFSKSDKEELTTTPIAPDGTRGPSTTTTTDTPTTPETSPDVEIAEPDPMPEVPTLYTQKYKDGLAGVWENKKAALMDTKFVKSIGQLAPQIGAGSCPQWQLDLNVMTGSQFGLVDSQFPCWVIPFLKAVIMLTALFAARRIVFGG